jgi:hypothetical protein
MGNVTEVNLSFAFPGFSYVIYRVEKGSITVEMKPFLGDSFFFPVFPDEEIDPERRPILWDDYKGSDPSFMKERFLLMILPNGVSKVRIEHLTPISILKSARYVTLNRILKEFIDKNSTGSSDFKIQIFRTMWDEFENSMKECYGNTEVGFSSDLDGIFIIFCSPLFGSFFDMSLVLVFHQEPDRR